MGCVLVAKDGWTAKSRDTYSVRSRQFAFGNLYLPLDRGWEEEAMSKGNRAANPIAMATWVKGCYLKGRSVAESTVVS